MINRTFRCVVAAVVAACAAGPVHARGGSTGLTCDDAIALPGSGGSVSFSRAGATVDLDFSGLCDMGPFGTDTNWNVVFYRWRPSSGSGTYELSTCGQADHDTRLAVLTACDVASVIACNDDGPGCPNFSSYLTFDAQCGTDYIIAVGGYSADTSLGSGTMTLSSVSALPCDCIDRLFASSPQLVPYSFSNPRVWTAAGIQPNSQGALLTVTARGQLGSATRFLTVKIDGLTLATSVFGSGSGAGTCTTTTSVASFPISATQFSQLTADGQLEVRIEPSINATSEGCSTAELEVKIEYRRDIVDCDLDGVDDGCQSAENPSQLDCNGNGVLDSCEIASGNSTDVNTNGQPDECELDCNGNDLPDSWEISQGLVPDCNQNGVPDTCDLASGGGSTDVDGNGVPDDCKADCNNNGLPDAYEIAQGLTADCDNNAVPDSCQIAADPGSDCNLDGIPDSCQGGPDGSDCDGNGRADVCDIANGVEDKNNNGRLDLCELRFGDLNLDGQINGSDLAGLLAVWGLPNPPYGDLDSDGQVGGTDLAFLLARWGPVP